MAQRKMDTRSKFASGAFALKRMGSSVRVSRGRDEDFISVERQREDKVGPDYDPNYFEKLDALIEENYGPVAKFTIVNN